MFKIEKDIDIPKFGEFKKGRRKYPWENMKVGDSFLIESYSESRASTVLSAGQKWSNRRGGLIKFSSRKIRDDFRIFRIK